MSGRSDEQMLLKTPFHSRIEPACELNCWGTWKGYTTPNAYTDIELEYFAIRSSCSVMDMTPMEKLLLNLYPLNRHLDLPKHHHYSLY